MLVFTLGTLIVLYGNLIPEKGLKRDKSTFGALGSFGMGSEGSAGGKDGRLKPKFRLGKDMPFLLLN